MNSPSSNQQELMKAALHKLEKMQAELESLRHVKNEPIAIIGMNCRFPGNCHTPADFWQLLAEGRHGIGPIPPTRWDVADYYSPDPDLPGKMYMHAGGFIDPIDTFDAAFFEISPREATILDPQQRLLLEVTWAALEDAQLVPEQLFGSQTGVFMGISSFDYNNKLVSNMQRAQIDAYFSTGNAHSTAAGRLSYFLRFNGPCISVDTACSSSLVALHLACQSLRLQESNLALVGGVNAIIDPDINVALCKARMLSPDNRCKTFDAGANGYARSEGCGVVVLKRLADAQADGNNVLAVIRGSAINQDGPSSGLTVPSGLAQETVIRQALTNAGVSPGDISYIEAHGTGTFLGDPIEANALAELFGPNRPVDTPLYVGSTKTNIGHMEAAAGIAGLIKVVLSMRHDRIPQHLNLEQFNPHINWDGLPLHVPTSPVDWPNAPQRLAGISSFGFSGTNAHVIVQAAPPLESLPMSAPKRPSQLLTLSAKTAEALSDQVRQYQDFLAERQDWVDICHTAGRYRSHFSHRLGLVAASTAEAQQHLAAFLEQKTQADIVTGQMVATPRVVFLFTGQGSQYVNMGRRLYQTELLFRQTVDACAQILETELDIPLLNLLYPDDERANADLINQTAYTQPLLFTIEYALAQLWQSWGLKPTAVLGHSVGEYVAACVAGVFSLADGLRLIAARGRLMQALPSNGQMVAVLADESRVSDAIGPYLDQVSIAAINGPHNVVISGQQQAITTIVAQLEAEGIKTRQLDVSHAFHSPQMDSILADFEAIASQVTFHQPRLPLISNLTGQPATTEIAQPTYWRDHIRQPVQFATAIATLQQQGVDIFLEIGPQPVLLGMARRCLPAEANIRWLPSLRPGQDDGRVLLRSLAALYAAGVTINWADVYANHSDSNKATSRTVTLPLYPFQKTVYWYNNTGQQSTVSEFEQHLLLGRRMRLAGTRTLHFEQQLSAIDPAFLADHAIFDTPILPATGYLEMALAAGRELFQTEALSLINVKIEQMLRLDGSAQTVQLLLTPATEGQSATFEIFSAVGDTDWQRHAHGQIKPTASPQPNHTLPAKQQPLPAGDIFYQQLRLRGLTYGPDFQGITGLWQTEAGVLGRIQLPANLSTEPFLLHPALSDACLQVLAATDARLSLPVGLKRLTLHRRPEQQVWCHALPPHSRSTDQQQANLHLFAESGALVAEFEGLQVEPVKPALLLRLLQGDVGQWFYQPVWQAMAAVAPPLPMAGRWLIFTDEPELPTAEPWPTEVILVTPAETFDQLSAHHYQLNPANPADFQRLLQAQPTLRGVIYHWGATSAQLDDDPLAWQKRICGGALHLVQALGQLPQPPRLWLVTVGAQPVATSGLPSVQPVAASLWGLGRVIAMEYPMLQCVRLDLDPAGPDNLLEAIQATDGEDQVAYRQGQRYVARLERYNQSDTQLHRPTEPFRVQLPADGILDNIALVASPRRAPAPGEVELRVEASGLNFRDVLTALGMMNVFLDEGKTAADLEAGGECSGTVVAVGQGVTHLQVGDEVISWARGSLGQFVTTPAHVVFPKPASLNFEEAATIPIVYLTVYYGLNRLAQMCPGERVLIHAAAGGVGQAAVQLAQQVGAEIYATASPGKWDFLREQGITHIMNSRTLDFAETVLELTNGQGVDIVLNSLNGEFITKSLETLRPGGRFVELGKLDILSHEQMAAQRPDVAYYHFDLLTVTQDNPNLVSTMFDELTVLIEASHLQPIPYRTFAIEQVVDAFRTMAQARHIGKVIISLADSQPDDERPLLQADATYLITGGLGALGRQVAAWLAFNGARHLLLTGRNGADPDDETLLLLSSLGATPYVVQADVSQQADVTRLLETLEALPPLRGVFHAAGVLADGVLQEQNWTSFERVLAPKVAGSWHLHQATQAMPLDYFVCFSSVASLWGSPGQGNYAAANAFIDALAHHRRGQGLPGLSLNWGPWAEVGMAARLGQDTRFEAMGLPLINPLAALEAMKLALSQPQLSQIGLVNINWEKFGQQSRGVPFFTDFSGDDAGGKGRGHLVAQLNNLPSDERKAALLAHLQTELARILGLSSPQQIEPHHRFFNLGLDSLMGVEFKNSLETGLGVPLAATMIFNYPTLDSLTDYLLASAFNAEDPVVSQSSLDLWTEAVLPAEIRPDGPPAPASPQAILLTGATGFLGAYLLDELLAHTQANIYCLVRSADSEAALKRVKDNLVHYELWNEAHTARIKPVVGDLAQPWLGLSEPAFRTLAGQVDLIYHNGAVVDLIQPYQAIQDANVLGTQEVLRLAATTKTKPVHYVSTIAQFLSDKYGGSEYIKESEVPQPDTLSNGYAQTKWVSEQFIFQAQERGIPAAIYRAGLITGHSQTGHTNITDVSSRMVQGCYQLGVVPVSSNPTNFVPVDYASQAIAHISRQPESLGCIFHIVNTKTAHFSDIAHWVNTLGYDLKIIPYVEWRAMLVQALEAGEENALRPMLPMLGPQTITLDIDQRFDCTNTLTTLADTGIACPSMASLFGVYLKYMLQAGIIDAPSQGELSATQTPASL